jgi:hypothetical protein
MLTMRIKWSAPFLKTREKQQGIPLGNKIMFSASLNPRKKKKKEYINNNNVLKRHCVFREEEEEEKREWAKGQRL